MSININFDSTFAILPFLSQKNCSHNFSYRMCLFEHFGFREWWMAIVWMVAVIPHLWRKCMFHFQLLSSKKSYLLHSRNAAKMLDCLRMLLSFSICKLFQLPSCTQFNLSQLFSHWINECVTWENAIERSDIVNQWLSQTIAFIFSKFK